MTFTCTLDANPAPSYSIWAGDGQSQKWVDLDTNKNSITLSLQKQHNKVFIFCRADGSLLGYPVNSDFKSYTVQCKGITVFMCNSFFISGVKPTNPGSRRLKWFVSCIYSYDLCVRGQRPWEMPTSHASVELGLCSLLSDLKLKALRLSE